MRVSRVERRKERKKKKRDAGDQRHCFILLQRKKHSDKVFPLLFLSLSLLAKVRSGRGAPGDFFLPLPSRPSLCGPLIEMRCGGCWLSRAELKEWSEEKRNKKERNAAVAVVVPSSSSERGSPCLFSFFAPLASPCPLSALVRALVLDLIVKESSSDNDASPRSKERGFSSSRARESAREREGLGRSFFLFSFASLVPCSPSALLSAARLLSSRMSFACSCCFSLSYLLTFLFST